MDIQEKIDKLIVEVIMRFHPELLDDDLSDILNNQRFVEEAKGLIQEELARQ